VTETINNIEVENWYNTLIDGNNLLSYRGEITSDIITSLIERLEIYFDTNINLKELKKITIHVFVESIQNIFHHALKISDKNIKFGIFAMNYFENSINIITGNYILKDRIQILTDRINQINSLSKDELKALYKLILNNNEFLEKEGGGLGLIDVSRKTGTQLEYNFLNINKNIYFYILKIKII